MVQRCSGFAQLPREQSGLMGAGGMLRGSVPDSARRSAGG